MEIYLPLVKCTIVEVSEEGRKHLWSILTRVWQYNYQIIEKIELSSFSKLTRRIDVSLFVRI